MSTQFWQCAGCNRTIAHEPPCWGCQQREKKENAAAVFLILTLFLGIFGVCWFGIVTGKAIAASFVKGGL